MAKMGIMEELLQEELRQKGKRISPAVLKALAESMGKQTSGKAAEFGAELGGRAAKFSAGAAARKAAGAGASASVEAGKLSKMGGALSKMMKGKVPMGLDSYGPWLLLTLLQLAANKGQGLMQQQQDIETIDRRAGAMSPDDIMYQALLPQAQEKSKMAEEAMIRQLLGVTGPSLAPGEMLAGR